VLRSKRSKNTAVFAVFMAAFRARELPGKTLQIAPSSLGCEDNLGAFD
jgi:hypothetical protein